MNEIESARLNESYRKFADGDQVEALHELQELAGAITEPWSKSALLYHETLFWSKWAGFLRPDDA